MQEKIITPQNEEQVWQQINAELNDQTEYKTVIVESNHSITLDIDIDLGGGFESGYSTTTFLCPLHWSSDFRFAVHREHFTDEIGKFFGMQDVEIGYSEFDEKFILKTNNEGKLKEIFADASVRQTLESITQNFTFGITHHSTDAEKNEAFLELYIEDAVTEITLLRKIYKAFLTVLLSIDRTK